MKWTRLAVAVLLLARTSLARAQEVRSLTIDQAISLAFERGPGLIAQEAERAGARARLAGAELPAQQNPDVQASVGPRYRPGGTGVDFGVGLSQPIEISGQRGARVEAARWAVSSTEARLEARRIELAADVRQAFGRALASVEKRRLAEDAQLLAGNALKAAEERWKAGAASRIEVNTAQVEIGRTMRERAIAEQRQAEAHGALALLIGVEDGLGLTLVGSLALKPAPKPGLAALIRQATSQRADLLAVRRELEANRAERVMTARQALPVPRIGATYSREDDAHIVQGTLALTLPLWNRNQASRGVASAKVSQIERTLEQLERAARTEVRLAANRLRLASAAADAYSGGALAALKENTELVSEAYRAGKVSFLELIIIRRQALEARRDYIEALEELYAADTQLRRALGMVR